MNSTFGDFDDLLLDASLLLDRIFIVIWASSTLHHRFLEVGAIWAFEAGLFRLEPEILAIAGWAFNAFFSVPVRVIGQTFAFFRLGIEPSFLGAFIQASSFCF